MKIQGTNSYNLKFFGNTALPHVFKQFRINSQKADCDLFCRNNVLEIALNNLNDLIFADEDIKKVGRYGAKLPFKSGKEAVDFAKKNNINIKFAHIDDIAVHAQWRNESNSVIINDKYKNTTNPAEILAISSAILHELSHAKDGDDSSSIQEELDCLAMNALAFNIFRKRNPELFSNIKSQIINDGVKIYTDLFMGNDEQALIKRVNLKYGTLPPSGNKHPLSAFAKKIAELS